jgi:hypothetical protein
MKYADMNFRERLELDWVKERLNWLSNEIDEIKKHPDHDADIWNLRNKADEIGSVFYNLYCAVYERQASDASR